MAMEFIGLPLKLDDRGWLVRSSRTEVLLAFIRAAALTHRNTWPPDPEFGLHDEFEKRWRVGLPQDGINQLNACLERFGWTDVRVLSIKRLPSDDNWSESSYVVTFATRDRGNVAAELNLASPPPGGEVVRPSIAGSH
jgi:hypothetical protein